MTREHDCWAAALPRPSLMLCSCGTAMDVCGLCGTVCQAGEMVRGKRYPMLCAGCAWPLRPRGRDSGGEG